MTASMWHSNILPVKVNVVFAERNRSLGLKGWNSHKSPLHHYTEKKTTKSMNFENLKFEIPSRTKSTFITAFSPDNSLIASCHGDHQIHIFDTKTRKLVKSLAGHERTPWCVTFHPGSNEILASGSLNGKVTVWDLRGDGSESWIVSSNTSVAVASLSFHPYDHVLAIAAGNEIYFWDWSRPKPFASVKTNSESEKVRFVRFDPWGHNILTGVANAEEEDDNVNDEPTFDHWSWLLPISRSWQTRSSEHRMLSRYRNRRRLHGTINSSLRDLPPSYPERPETDSHHTTENRRFGTRLSDLMHRRRRPNTGNRENHSRSRNNSSTDSDDESNELSQEVLRRRRARLSTATTERETGNEDTVSSNRCHLAQAHQRILHAQVSVNAEIQQQYNRLQQLRQERHRLEMRLRELQNSANEVRYSTPALEISFPTSESMDSLIQQSNSTEGSYQHPLSEANTASLSSSNHPIASISSTTSAPQPVPPPVSTYSRPYTYIFRQRPATSINTQQDSPPGSLLTGGVEVTEEMMENNEEVENASISANQETSSEMMDISIPGAEMSVTFGNNSRTSGDENVGTSRDRFIDFMSIVDGNEFHQSLSNTIQSSLLENNEDRSTPSSSASRMDTNQRNSWRELNPSWESEMFGLDDAHNYALPSFDRIMSRTESNLDAFSRIPSPSFIHVINPPRYSSMFPDAATSSSSSNLSLAPTITISLPDPVLFPLSVTSPNESPPLLSTSQDPVPTPFLSSISSSQTWLLPRNQESVQSPSLSVATSQPVEQVVQSSDPVQFPPAPETSISSAESLSRAVDYLMQATDSLSQTADSLLQEATDSASYLLEERNNELLGSAEDWIRTVDQDHGRSEAAGAHSPGSRNESNNSTTSPEIISTFQHPENPNGTSSSSRLSHHSSSGSSRHSSTVVYSTLGRRTSILQTTHPTVISSMDPTVERLLNDPALDEIQTNMQTDRQQEQQHQVMQDVQTDNNQHQNQPVRARNEPVLSLGELASRNVNSARRLRRSRRMYNFGRELRLRLERQEDNLENEESGGSRRTLGYIGRRDNITSSSPGNRFPGEGVGRDLPRDLSRVYNESIPTPPTMRPQPRGVYNVLRQHQRSMRLSRRHMRSNINRIISSVYADNNGHRAVALNIENTTYRLQCWDFSQLKLPEISRSDINVIVPHCKIYNDASIDISQDGTLLATFVPTFVGYPDNMINVGIFSLEAETFGQLLFKKSYGPNATCLSISPLNNFICVGLKSRQFLLVDARPSSYLMAQVLKLEDRTSEMPVVRHIYHPAQEIHRIVSINTMSWVPEVGRGVVYGTNVGDLRMCLPSWGNEVQASSGMSDYEM